MKTNPDHVRQIDRECRLRNQEKLLERHRKWLIDNPEKYRVYNLMSMHPKRYPLDDKCAFCGARENLERGHLDYEDDGFNYLTVCPSCNYYMFEREKEEI